MSSISALQPMRELNKLKAIDLTDCPVDPTPIILEHRELAELHLSKVTMHDGLHGVESILPQLAEFSITHGPIGDPASLAKLERTERLFLSGSDIDDLHPIAQLPRLRDLFLYGCAAQLDLSPLRELPRRATICLLRSQEVQGLDAVRRRHRVKRI